MRVEHHHPRIQEDTSPVESVQCPSCGAAIQLEPGAKIAVCDYCGTNLRITKGASGHPLAVLGSISVDTGILAREAAYRRLQERLAGLRQERAKHEGHLSELKAQLTRPSVALDDLERELTLSSQAHHAVLDHARTLGSPFEQQIAAKMPLFASLVAVVGSVTASGPCSGVALVTGLLAIVSFVWLRRLEATERHQDKIAALQADIQLMRQIEGLERLPIQLDAEIGRVRSQMAQMKAEIDDLTEEL